MRKFRNSILELSNEVQQEINQLIDTNTSANGIHQYLTDKYTNEFLIPSIPTIVKYTRYYNLERRKVVKQEVEERLMSSFKDSLAEIQNIVNKVSLEESPNFEKIKVLDGLVGKCLLRAHAIENSKEGKVHTSNAETSIIHYYSEVRKTIETILKLAANFKQDEATLIQIINSEAKLFLEMVRDTVLEVCPEKAELFKKAFDRRLIHKIPEHAIEVIPSVEVEDAPSLEQLKEPAAPGSIVLKEPAEEQASGT